MRRALPSLIGIIAVGACLRKAFSKATDDIADEFGDDAHFAPSDWLHLTTGLPPVDAPGSRHTDRAQHLTLSDDLEIIPLVHSGSNTNPRS